MEDVIRKMLLATPSPSNFIPTQPNTATKTVYNYQESYSPEPKRIVLQQTVPTPHEGTPPRMSMTRQVGDWQESERVEMVNGVPTRVKVRTRTSETMASPTKDQGFAAPTAGQTYLSQTFPQPAQPPTIPSEMHQSQIAKQQATLSPSPQRPAAPPSPALKAELEALKAQNQQLETKLNKALAELASRELGRPDIVKLNRVYEELTQTVDSLRNEVFDLKAALQRGVVELEHTKALLKASLDEEQRIRAELKERSREADRNKLKAEEAEKHIKNAQTELEITKKEVAELKSTIEPLQKERSRLMEELADVVSNMGMIVCTLTVFIQLTHAAVKDKLAKLIIQHNKLGQDCEERIRELLARLESKENTPKPKSPPHIDPNLLEDQKQLQAELARMLQNLKDSESQNRAMQDTIDKLQAELDQKDQQQPDPRELDELAQRIKELERNEADLIDDLVNTKAALKDAEYNRIDPQQVQHALVHLLNRVRDLRNELDSTKRAEEIAYRGTNTYMNSLKGIIRDKVDLVPKGTVATMIRRIRERDDEIARLGGRPLSSSRKPDRDPSAQRAKNFAKGWNTNESRYPDSGRYKENEAHSANHHTDGFDSFGGATQPKSSSNRSTSRPEKRPGILKPKVQSSPQDPRERQL